MKRIRNTTLHSSSIPHPSVPVTVGSVSLAVTQQRVECGALLGGVVTTLRRLGGQQINSGREADMAMHARLADVAVESAMEARMRTKAALDVIEHALSDHVVTPQEATAMAMYARQALFAAEGVVTAAERANVGQKAVLSMLTVTPFNPHVRQQMAEVGLEFPDGDSAA